MLIKMLTYFGWLPITAIIVINFQLSLCGPLPSDGYASSSEQARRMYVPSVEDCIQRGQMDRDSLESAESRSIPISQFRNFRLFQRVEMPFGNERKFALLPTSNDAISLPFLRLPLSPIQLFGPNDIYYCTEDEKGQVVIRKMSKENILKLIATGGGSMPIPTGESTNVNGYQPEMTDVVKNVKNVVGHELSKPTTTITAMPTIPGHVNSEWSSILPSILSGEPDVGIPQQPASREPDDPPILPHSETLPTSEQPDDKTMIPVPLVTKDQINNNNEKGTQTSKPVYEILSTFSPDKVTVSHQHTGDQDQVAGSSEAIKPILITSTSKPELSGSDNANENKIVTVSVISTSSSTSVKVSGQDEVKIHQEDPPKFIPVTIKPSKPNENDANTAQIIDKDNGEPTTEENIEISTTHSSDPESSESITENPEIKDGFSTYTIVSNSETKENDNKVVETSSAEIRTTKKPDEEFNSFEKTTPRPENVASSLESGTTDRAPITDSKDSSETNDIKNSISSVLSQVTDPTLSVISTLEDQKSKITTDKEPIESKIGQESHEFDIEESTSSAMPETTTVSDKLLETTPNLLVESSPDMFADEPEGSGMDDTSTEAPVSEEVNPHILIINSEETISDHGSSESHDDKPEIVLPDISGTNSDVLSQTTPSDAAKIDTGIDESTDIPWLEAKPDEAASTATPEKSNPGKDSTESPILRISVTPKEEVSSNNLPGAQEDGNDVNQSNIVRIQPMNPMSTVHDILQTAPPNSTPDYEHITLPSEKTTAANDIASGLIAGFNSNEKSDGMTIIPMPSITFDELPKAGNKGGPKPSSTSSEMFDSSGAGSDSSETPIEIEKPDISGSSTEESAEPSSNSSEGSVSTSSTPSKNDVTTKKSEPTTENPGSASAETQTRPKVEKKDTGMEGFEKVSTIAPPESKTSSTSEQTKATQMVSGIFTTEATKWVPVSQPEESTTKTDSASKETKPEERVTPSPPVDDPKTSPGLDTSTDELDPHNAYFYNLSNELALKMWTAINSYLKPSRTIAVSPFGLSGMLGMIYLGAHGNTSEEMNEILKLDDERRTFNPHLVFQDVSDTIVLARNQGIANVVFVEELFADKGKMKLKGYYKDKVRRFYKGIVTEVNFNYVSDVIRRRTNLMVRKDTGGKIRDFIRGNQLPLRTPMSALSANVFQTDCSTANVSSEGRDGELYFTVSAEIRQRRLIPLPAVLWKSGVYAGYESSLDASAFALGGPENVVSTIFVTPGDVVAGSVDSDDNLEKLERRLIDLSLHDGAWNKLLKKIIPRPSFELQIPKFSHTSIINATAALKSMGFKKLFTREAYLIDTPQLHLSDVFQMNLFTMCGDQNLHVGKHLEEVYPTGPIRSSRTYEELEDYEDSTEDKETNDSAERLPKYSRQDENTRRFSLNTPFLYFVRHNPTGLILHMGRFNPRSQ